MKIGPYQFVNQLILAPMAGVTDLPYRNICREMGAGAAVGEMLSANQGLWKSSKSSFRQVQEEEQHVRWIQILGNDPKQMAETAKTCEDKGAHIIDINMGCPAKKVCKKAAGSALMQNEKLVAEILEQVVQAVNIPVTLKIRTGWNKENKNFLNIAEIAEEKGIAALSIHGRTRACKYNEVAEYESAKILKQSLSIPLIVNGDIVSAKKAKSVLDHTQADGIMIGRAALGNPWLFRNIECFLNHEETPSAPSLEELYQTISKHIRALHAFYGPYLGLRISRKHLSWYEEQFPSQLCLKKQFNRLENAQDQLRLVDQYFTRYEKVDQSKSNMCAA
jgi:tRNA-dihydrouridine synthase B